MDRYVPEDGLVRSISEDLTDTWNFLSNNLNRRSKIIIGRGNLKIVDGDSFKFDHDYLGGTDFYIRLLNIPAVRFDDGSIYAPESPVSIDKYIALVAGTTYSVCISKTTSYSEPGTYTRGTPYPTPAEGDNTMVEVGIELDVLEVSAVSTSSTSLVLYNIVADSLGVITIEDDFRESLGITVPISGVHIIPESPSDISVTTVYGGDRVTANYGSGVSLAPFLDTDSTMFRETSVQIEWDITDAWMYEVKIIPYINGVANRDFALSKMKINDGLPTQRVMIPYANTQKVNIEITPLSKSIHRDRGDTTTVYGFIVGSDRYLSVLPIIDISSEVLSTYPASVTFSVSANIDNISVEIILSGSSGDITIYRGNAGNITLPIPPGTWTPKVTGILLSGERTPTISGSQFTIAPPSTSSGCAEMLQTAVISLAMVSTTTAEGLYVAGYFYGPAGNATLKKMILCSLGSYTTTKYHNRSVNINISDPDSDLGASSSTLLTIEEGSDFEWPYVARDTNPPSPYNLTFSSEALNFFLEENKLYRIDINLNDNTNDVDLLIGGTILLSIAPVDGGE